MAGDKEGLNMKGIMYRHGLIYDIIMKYTDIDDEIPKALLERIRGSDVLELGCGTGRFAKYLPEGIAYKGIDLNETFIEYGKKKGRDLVKGDILKGKLPKADTVLLRDILHHVNPYHQQLIEKAKGIANKTVLISDCYDRKKSVAGMLTSVFGKILDSDGINENVDWMEKEEVTAFLKKNGGKNMAQVKSHIICEIPVRPRKP